MKSDNTHGGRRMGSGRKPRGTVQVSLRFSPELITVLDIAAKSAAMTKSEFVEKILRKSLKKHFTFQIASR